MRSLALGAAIVLVAGLALAQGFEKDVIPTSTGELSSPSWDMGRSSSATAGKTIHVDPVGKLADYATLPKADLVLITHSHGDHLDPAAIAAIRKPETQVVVAPDCEGKVEGALVMQNGERKTLAGINVAAVPAYNLVHTRPDGTPYHPKGRGQRLRDHASATRGSTSPATPRTSPR